MKTIMTILRIVDIKNEYAELCNHKRQLEAEYRRLEKLWGKIFSECCMAAKWGRRDEWRKLRCAADEYDKQRCAIGMQITHLQSQMYALEHEYTVLVNRHKLIEKSDYPYNLCDL